MPDILTCPVCQSEGLQSLGVKQGHFVQIPFHVNRCNACRFVFVGNPLENDREIYDSEYYRGGGADHSIDYLYEVANPTTTNRKYEWEGITKAICEAGHWNHDSRWLDFGCGLGGLVQFAQKKFPGRVLGYTQGWALDWANRQGIPTIESLEKARDGFDIVTAIEVLEHAKDPIATLKSIRSLLKPGGVFFYTTQNAVRHRRNPLAWNYLVPEVHISFFEPETMKRALERTGFEPAYRSCSGWEGILRYRALKTLGMKNCTWFERLLPWKILSSLIDWKYKMSAFPMGIAH